MKPARKINLERAAWRRARKGADAPYATVCNRRARRLKGMKNRQYPATGKKRAPWL